jgi:hypothetical protein
VDQAPIGVTHPAHKTVNQPSVRKPSIPDTSGAPASSVFLSHPATPQCVARGEIGWILAGGQVICRRVLNIAKGLHLSQNTAPPKKATASKAFTQPPAHSPCQTNCK